MAQPLQGSLLRGSSTPVAPATGALCPRRFSVQLFSGEEFTGFTNKPWGNDVAFNRQQLQGTWADKDGRLAWVRAQLTIERIHKSFCVIQFAPGWD